MLKSQKIGIIINCCLLLFFIAGQNTSAQISTAQQLQQESTQLQQQLQEIESQIAQYEKELTSVQAEKNTLAKKIKQLKAQQAKIKLQIRQTNLRLQDIKNNLTETQDHIGQNNQRLSWLKDEMSAGIREIYIQDQRSLIEILFSQGGLSGFSAGLNAYKTLNQQLASALEQVKTETADLQAQEQKLVDQKQQQQDLIAIINLQNDKLLDSLQNQNSLLEKTKGREENYQAVLSDSKKRAAEIRNRIYNLFGVGKNITFGQAVQIAQWVSTQTGVRAAFLLAVLTQESNLGKNVGTCNRPGDPPEKSWKVIMKPERDQEPFKQIAAELGLDPDTTPVSCPMRDKTGKQIGWGGAMGPAQFIPSTWLGYKDKVAGITGKTADPWDIRDAFIAAGIKLAADGGASPDGEWAAAMRYFSGSTNAKFSFYGDNVIAIAEQYDSDIKELNNNAD